MSVFIGLFKFLQGRFWLVCLLLVGLTGISLFFITQIRWVEDISDFLPQSKSNQSIETFYKQIGNENKIIIRLRSLDTNPDKEMLNEAVEYLAQTLKKNDSACRIKDLLYKVDEQEIADLSQFLINNLPYFLSTKDYIEMDSLLRKDNICRQLLQNQEMLAAFPPDFVKEALLNDPLQFSRTILKQLNILQLGEKYNLRDGYMYNAEETEVLLTLQAYYSVTETANNKLLIRDIDTAVARTIAHFGHQLQINAFGQSMVSITNAEQIKKDSIFAVILSIALIIGLLIYFFRSFRSILLIVVSIGFGFLFALGCISAVSPTVSVIAIGIVSIILGIAVNYPLHLLAHYQHVKDRKQLLSEMVPPLLIGNITTVGAFLSLLFISSQAMRTLGLFSSLLLVGTILFVLIFLPHFLGKNLNNNSPQPRLVFEKTAHFSPEKNKWILGCILILTAVFAYFSTQTSFETDMHKINYMTDAQRMEFDRLMQQKDTACATLYCLNDGKMIENPLTDYQKLFKYLSILQEDSLIRRQSGIGIFLPSKDVQNMKIKQWNQFWETRKEPFLQDLAAAAKSIGFKLQTFDGLKENLNRNYTVQELEYFDCLRKNLTNNYILQDTDKTLIFTVLFVPKEYLSTVQKELNKHCPSAHLFDDRSITTQMVEALSDDFSYVLYICGAIVFLFLFFAFGRIELAFLSFLPMLVGWLWILGLMGILGLKFNIVSIILATFIFGQGDDYTIFITEGLIYEHRFGKKMLAQFKNSIILSALIMFIAIGILIFAQHPAMRSLAEVTIVGMITVVWMAYIFPPFIFRFLTHKKGKPRFRPVTFWNLLKTTLVFLVFIIGSISLTFLGLTLYLFGQNSERNRSRFRYCVCYTFRFFVKIMPQVGFRLDNSTAETFEKPAVIIANHQSHFDLLYLLSLSPNITCLTNAWVQKFPLYRIIIKLAGYFSLEGEIDDNLDKFQTALNAGHSVLIFPEGTRSADGSVLRFHKGAFYVAQRLQMDILPILTHGIGDVLPKSDLLVHAGRVTLRILERIKPQDLTYCQEKTCWETTKAVRHFYRNAYAELRRVSCDINYYRQLVMENYLYKGREVSCRCRRALRDFTAIQHRLNQLPTSGTVFLSDCGQGEIALLLSLLRPDLSFIATDSNPELLQTARNCTSIPSNLHYIEPELENTNSGLSV